MKKYFRSEVRDIDRVPADGGALIVSNHSGGLIADGRADHRRRVLRPLRPRPRRSTRWPTTCSSPAPRATRCARPASSTATRENAAAVLAPGAVTIVLPRRRLRQLPADPQHRRDRLQRPHRLRPHRARGRRPDRAGRQHRRPGGPAAPVARRADRQAVRPPEAAAHGLRPGQRRLPVRADLRRSRPTSRCRPRSSPRCSSRSTSAPSSATTRTSPRSTPRSAAGCRRPSTSWPRARASRCSDESTRPT